MSKRNDFIVKQEMLLKRLILMLIYITGWEEDYRKVPGEKIYRSWKGYNRGLLQSLGEEGYIIDNRKASSVRVTEKGVSKGNEIFEKFIGFWNEIIGE